jgi:hypothetical protein
VWTSCHGMSLHPVTIYISVMRKHSRWRRARVATALVQLDAMSQGFSDGRCSESVPFDLKYLGEGVSGKLHHGARADYFIWGCVCQLCNCHKAVSSHPTFIAVAKQLYTKQTGLVLLSVVWLTIANIWVTHQKSRSLKTKFRMKCKSFCTYQWL